MPEVSDWFSLSWFYPSTFQNFTWEYRFFLILLVRDTGCLSFEVAVGFQAESRSSPLPCRKPKSNRIFISVLRIIPDLLFALMIAMLILALARPQTSNEKVEQWTEGIDIMLVSGYLSGQ
jgi:Ca-activated chloride channel family protein